MIHAHPGVMAWQARSCGKEVCDAWAVSGLYWGVGSTSGRQCICLVCGCRAHAGPDAGRYSKHCQVLQWLPPWTAALIGQQTAVTCCGAGGNPRIKCCCLTSLLSAAQTVLACGGCLAFPGALCCPLTPLLICTAGRGSLLWVACIQRHALLLFGSPPHPCWVSTCRGCLTALLACAADGGSMLRAVWLPQHPRDGAAGWRGDRPGVHRHHGVDDAGCAAAAAGRRSLWPAWRWVARPEHAWAAVDVSSGLLCRRCSAVWCCCAWMVVPLVRPAKLACLEVGAVFVLTAAWYSIACHAQLRLQLVGAAHGLPGSRSCAAVPVWQSVALPAVCGSVSQTSPVGPVQCGLLKSVWVSCSSASCMLTPLKTTPWPSGRLSAPSELWHESHTDTPMLWPADTF